MFSWVWLSSFLATLGPKRPLEIKFDVRGCSYPPWQFILLSNCFPQPRNDVYCCVCIGALVCVELGVEVGPDQLDKSGA